MRDGRILASHETPRDMVDRVVAALTDVESRFGTGVRERRVLADELGHLLDAKKVVMSTPILNNAGRHLGKPLSACSVPPVNLRGDLRAVKKTIDRYHADGMGTGFNLDDTDDPVSMLRFLNHVAVQGVASGIEDRPVGNMATLSVHHPRILDFIDAKAGVESNGEIWKFNISVDATDGFMHAVARGTSYGLHDGRRLDAREVFHRITRRAQEGGDPGLIFLDRMNKDNPTPAVGAYVSTAPCAEVGLLPGETCQFGYLNVGQFVRDDPYGVPWVDYTGIECATMLMTRVLDNALDISIARYQNSGSRKVMRMKRKIGVGLCGLADLLVRLRIPYDSDRAREVSSELVMFINFASKRASYDLGRQRGSCGAMRLRSGNRYFNTPGYLEQKYAPYSTSLVTSAAWKELSSAIRTTGTLRNVTTVALPPTGRSGPIIDASTGVEPLFTLFDPEIGINASLRKDLRMLGLLKPRLLRAIASTGRIGALTDLPAVLRKVYRTALEISPKGHLLAVASMQHAVDESISKTINMPTNATAADVADIYRSAYELGLKGITIYRTGSRTDQPRALAVL
ncbi:MAG: hypothetical protein HY567_04715 [Candidatus Kerfeldbacteria bacterium]|nr:hypothetical protein [Candidatus Kerfeldbacteria bacterium]